MVRKGTPKPEQFGGPAKPLSAFALWMNIHKDTEMVNCKKILASQGKPYSFFAFNTYMHTAFKTKCLGDEKVRLDTMVKQQKDMYKTQFAAWQATPQFQDFKKAQASYKKTKEVKKAKKTSGMPKKPPSAYFLYLAAVRDQITTKLKQTHGAAFKNPMVAAEASKMWNVCTPEQKKPFEIEAQRQKAQHKHDLEEYKKTEAYKQFAETVEQATAHAKKTVKRAKASAAAGDEPKQPRAKRPRKEKAAAPADGPKPMRGRKSNAAKAAEAAAVAHAAMAGGQPLAAVPTMPGMMPGMMPP